MAQVPEELVSLEGGQYAMGSHTSDLQTNLQVGPQRNLETLFIFSHNFKLTQYLKFNQM